MFQLFNLSKKTFKLKFLNYSMKNDRMKEYYEKQ